MDINDVFAERRCIRQFRPDEVDRVVLQRVLAAAAKAPSANNEQPWEFYVTTGVTRHELGSVLAQTTVYLREYVETLSPDAYDRAFAWYSSLGDAPVLIVVTAPDSDEKHTETNRLLSVGAALENFLLAATAEGLGACPFTFSSWVEAELSDVLHLQEDRIVVCCVAVGWPKADEDISRPAKRTDVAVWLD